MTPEENAAIKATEAELQQLLGPDYSVMQRENYHYLCLDIVHLPTATEAIHTNHRLIPIFKGDSRGYTHCRRDDPDHVASLDTKAKGKGLARKIKDMIEQTILYQRSTLDPRIAEWDAIYQREADADAYVNKHLGTDFSGESAASRTEYIKAGDDRFYAERRGGGKFSLSLRDITPEQLVAVVDFLQHGNRPGIPVHYQAASNATVFPYQDEIESLALHTGQDSHAIYTDGLTLNLKYSDEKKGWIHHENA